MSRNIIAIIFLVIGLLLDRVIHIGIAWLFLGGLLAFLTLFREKNKKIPTKIIYILSIIEIFCGIVRIVLIFV